jgi:hypothetical protein
MSKLSRLKVGVDVPWVTSWSGEDLLGVGPCPEVGGRLGIRQVECAGYGRPQYSRNHLRRQRESTVRMLCPMCGEPTEAGDRWTQTGRLIAAGALRRSGLAAVTPPGAEDERVLLDCGAIPPLHRTCAERSRDQCPHLIAHATPELLAFPDTWYVAPLLIEARPEAPAHFLAAGRQPPASVPVISFLQLCGITEDCDTGWKRRPV